MSKIFTVLNLQKELDDFIKKDYFFSKTLDDHGVHYVYNQFLNHINMNNDFHIKNIPSENNENIFEITDLKTSEIFIVSFIESHRYIFPRLIVDFCYEKKNALLKNLHDKFDLFIFNHFEHFKSLCRNNNVYQIYLDFLTDVNGGNFKILKTFPNNIFKVVDSNQNIFFICFQSIALNQHLAHYPNLIISNVFTEEEFNKKSDLLKEIDNDFLISLLFSHSEEIGYKTK